ncbi:hydrogenase subunit MbhD domain-containing protein [Erythrobacter sp. HL-111]|uniref:hydrogenase subunit MbhD domain-containing protein n=1 Tax=Erythrobacter sp. HL-111 TaxID=1798193 RepID=UPI0006D99E3B|nr:hydrogenase subunit MbhD domain-containing protein [Erythrobacter sp. HL-111]KPP88194.1 MAG: putative subunit of the Multisubunit Na+/H+ antiporter [Erythrobacteraceae bacterium HL-111]SDS95075.1 multisubunit sodium/proton antiporter, MrpB subunit [Erythrobacter sp. HL-111]
MTGYAATGFDLVLAALILATAGLAISVRDLFAAVVFFIVYGIFVALAWLRLGAIDVALTEAALGAGLTGVLLIGAVARLARNLVERRPEGSGEGGLLAAPPVSRAASPAARIPAMLGSAGISAVLGWAFLAQPADEGLRGPVAANLASSGVTNPVTAVLLNFRGWDTLLESVVLLAALTGVWALARDEDWGLRPGLRQHARAAGVLATFGRLLPPFGLLLGVYLVWVGASRPGGAFQGGTVLAAVWLLVMMAGLMAPPRVTSPRIRAVLIAGPLLFLAIGLAGALAGTFLALPPAVAKWVILLIESGLTLSIAATLALLVLGPPQSPATPAGHTRDRP